LSVIESREETRQTTLHFIYDSRTLYRSVMLHASNPIKGLYFDMSTKSYVGKLAAYKVSALLQAPRYKMLPGISYFTASAQRQFSRSA